MICLFCDNVFDHKLVESDYALEYKAAQRMGFQTALFSFEELVDGNILKALKFVSIQEHKTQALYRGWMLRPSQYKQFYDGLLSKNIELINNHQAYKHAHYLPEWYDLMKDHTPKSNWTEAGENIGQENIFLLTNAFGNKPIIIKDYVKSEKHHWAEACFIPDASDKVHLWSVAQKFIELRGDYLNEGLVFRAFEELEFLTNHTKSGMPLTKEYRLFFALGKMIAIFDYWDEGVYGKTDLPLGVFSKLATKIQSSFFTMDVAKKKNGEWIVMELGDGQVAGLPDNADVAAFYLSLNIVFLNH